MTKLIVAVAAFVLGVGVVGTTRGVERERSIAANEAIFEELPVFPGSQVRSVRSGGERESESPWSLESWRGHLLEISVDHDAR